MAIIKKKFRRNEQYYSNINRAYGSLLVADSLSGWTKVHPYNKTEPMALCQKAENKEIYNAIALTICRKVNINYISCNKFSYNFKVVFSKTSHLVDFGGFSMDFWLKIDF